MKKFRLGLLSVLLFSAFLFQPFIANAVVYNGVVSELSTTPTTPVLTKKQYRKMERLESRLAKMKHKFENATGVDFKDPVKKWMWFWIFGWGIGIVITALLGYIGGLFIAAGTVCLIIWILKFTGSIS